MNNVTGSPLIANTSLEAGDRGWLSHLAKTRVGMGDRERIICMVNLIYNELRIFLVLKDLDEREAQDYLYQNEGDCEIESARSSSADTVLDTTLEDKQGNFSIG